MAPINTPVAFKFCGMFVVADGKVGIGVFFTGLDHRLKREFIAFLNYKENKVRTCVTQQLIDIRKRTSLKASTISEMTYGILATTAPNCCCSSITCVILRVMMSS